MDDQIILFDPTDTVDPGGTEEALKQLSDARPKDKHSPFNYYLAHLFLILSTVVYERDDSLVRSAAAIMRDMNNDDERARAAALLDASEQTIDTKAQLLGMRFMGISELKSLCGPYAGLFYNDESIILVYKGTSVLAFNEYLVDLSIQRVDAREYLYGEVHKGFYESLFPDPVPLDCYEQLTHDRTNPFQTIMDTVFEIAQKLKEKTGKPINFWITGHSLGGALAALTMARLQMPLRVDDPLFKGCDPVAVRTLNSDGSPRTVWQEMLSRYKESSLPTEPSSSTISSFSLSSAFKTPFNFLHRHDKSREFQVHHSHSSSTTSFQTKVGSEDEDDLVIFRDCYTFASPKLGDSAFAREFDIHHSEFVKRSSHKPMYYRVIVDKDVVPKMPPSCDNDPDDDRQRMFPCMQCDRNLTKKDDGSAPLLSHQHNNHKVGHSTNYGSITTVEGTAAPLPSAPARMSSLLDYKNVGQLVSLYSKPLPPTVKPSEFQTNYCADILRTDESTKELLCQIELALSPPTSESSTVSSETSQTTVFNAQMLAEEVDHAKLQYDLDTPSRLRIPCEAEKFLLTFPNVISHSPATYQRNLIRSRYFFTSFPGTEMEQRIQRVLEFQEQQHVLLDVDGVVSG